MTAAGDYIKTGLAYLAAVYVNAIAWFQGGRVSFDAQDLIALAVAIPAAIHMWLKVVEQYRKNKTTKGG